MTSITTLDTLRQTLLTCSVIVTTGINHPEIDPTLPIVATAQEPTWSALRSLSGLQSSKGGPCAAAVLLNNTDNLSRVVKAASRVPRGARIVLVAEVTNWVDVILPSYRVTVFLLLKKKGDEMWSFSLNNTYSLLFCNSISNHIRIRSMLD